MRKKIKAAADNPFNHSIFTLNHYNLQPLSETKQSRQCANPWLFAVLPTTGNCSKTFCSIPETKEKCRQVTIRELKSLKSQKMSYNCAIQRFWLPLAFSSFIAFPISRWRLLCPWLLCFWTGVQQSSACQCRVSSAFPKGSIVYIVSNCCFFLSITPPQILTALYVSSDPRGAIRIRDIHGNTHVVGYYFI